MSNSWLSESNNANRFKNIYLQGFLDISGRGLTLWKGNLTVNGSTILNSNKLNTYSYDFINFNTNFGKKWQNINQNSNQYIQKSISISSTAKYQVYAQQTGNIFISSQSGISDSWIDTNINSFESSGTFQQIVISRNGRYIVAIIRPPSAYGSSSTGKIYLSSDFGNTFPISNISILIGFPQSVSMSYDGKYMTMVTSNIGSAKGYVYISSNYGTTWSQKISVDTGFKSVAVSVTGQYQITVPFSSGSIRYSTDYGESWITSPQNIDNTISEDLATTFSNLDTYDYDFSKTIDMSYDGKYVTTFALNTGTMIMSSNYVTGSWTDVPLSALFNIDIGVGGFLSEISISSTGQFQVVGCYNQSTNGSVILSTNYGVSWSQIFINTILSYIPANSSYYFNSISLSSCGNFINGTIKYYDNIPSFICGNVYLSTISSSIRELVSINTFGSSNSGNVFSHPLSISAPNNLNSGLYLGYDVENSNGYMNSLNSMGPTNMCLQSQGGFIGIGNSFPKYTLDVSGEVYVSNHVYLNKSIIQGNSSINYSTVSGYPGISNALSVISDNLIIKPSNVGIIDNGNIFLQPSGGKIGIGKLSANFTLDIAGTVNISNANQSGLIMNSTNIQTYGSGYGMNLDSVSRPVPSSQIVVEDVLSNTTDIVFKTAPVDSNGSFQNNVERMRIANYGSVGIGTNSPSADHKLDVSGSLRVGFDSGSTLSTTMGSIILTHKNTNNSSSILFTDATNTTPKRTNHSAITYYDSVISTSQAFPVYGFNQSSIMTIDCNTSNGSFGNNNVVIRANGRVIIDTYNNTYFTKEVSIGKPTCDANYLLDISGNMNVKMINSTKLITNDISCNGSILVHGNIITTTRNSMMKGFSIDSPNIIGNIATMNTLNVTDISISNNLIIQNIVSTTLINSTSTRESTSVNTGSIVTLGGIGCAKSMYIGKTLYSDGIDASFICVRNPPFTGEIQAYMDYKPDYGGRVVADTLIANDRIILADGGSFISTPLSISTEGIQTREAFNVYIGRDPGTSGILYAARTFINGAATFESTSLVKIQNTTPSTTYENGALVVTGGVGIGDSVTIGTSSKGLLTANYGITVNNQLLTINAGCRLTGSNNSFTCEGRIILTNNTNATSETTGALVVSGGIGVAKDIYVGGGLMRLNYYSSGPSKSVISMNTSAGRTIDNPNIQIAGLDDGSQFSAHLTFSTSIPQYSAGALAERMRIRNDGNVGIGTTNPAYKLHVDGNAYFSSGVNFGSSASIQHITLYDHYNIYNNVSIIIQSSTFRFNMNNGSDRFIWSVGNSTADGYYQLMKLTAGKGLIIGQSDDDVSNSISDGVHDANALCIVGKGTYPYRKIHMWDDVVVDKNISSTSLHVSRVGINNTNPQYDLHVTGNAYFSGGINIERTSETGTAGINFLTNGNWVSRIYENYNLHIETDDNLYLTAQNSNGVGKILITGNVGIGTTNPLQTLHLNGSILLDGMQNGWQQSGTRGIGYGSDSGNISVNGFSGMDIQSVNALSPYNGNYSQNLRFWTHHCAAGTGGTPRLFIRYDGNIGINNVNPEYKLHVGGTGYFSETLTAAGGLTIPSGATISVNGTLDVGSGSLSCASITTTGDIYMNNARTIRCKNAAGSDEIFLHPRWSDNVTYLNYGSGGFRIRTYNGSSTAMFIDNNLRIYPYGGLNFGSLTSIEHIVLYDVGNEYNNLSIRIQSGTFRFNVNHGEGSNSDYFVWSCGNKSNTTSPTGYYKMLTLSKQYGLVIGTSTDNISNSISDGVHDANALCIVGKGTVPNRKIHLWDNVVVDGKLHVSSGITMPNTAGITWGEGYSKIYENGNLNIETDDNMYIKAPISLTITTPAMSVSGSLSARSYIPNGSYYTSLTAICDTDMTGITIGTGDGATSSSFNLAICSWFGIGFVDTCDNGCRIFMNLRTGIVSAASFDATSDYRIKENIEPITATIDNLNPIKYYNTLAKKEDMGFIAHEIQEEFPFLVSGEKDGENNQTLNYLGLIALLTKELQELKSTVKSLQTKIDILESK